MAALASLVQRPVSGFQISALLVAVERLFATTLPPVNSTVPSARSVRLDQARLWPMEAVRVNVGVAPLMSIIQALPSLSMVKTLSAANMAVGLVAPDTN